MSNIAVDHALPPHPELPAYYSAGEGKASFLRAAFDGSAVDYERVERVLALGSGLWHRKQALQRAGLCAGMRVLDVATGTGLVARAACQLIGATGRTVGIDPSIGMLQEARDTKVSAVQGRGEALPFGDAQFDFLSMGYALRHLSDLRVAFAEFHRVLRPGGRLCILELTRPAGVVRRGLLRGYFRVLLPVAAGIVSTTPRTRLLWRYFWDTIERCVPPHDVMAALRDVGFADVSRHLSFGLFSEYTAARSARA